MRAVLAALAVAFLAVLSTCSGSGPAFAQTSPPAACRSLDVLSGQVILSRGEISRHTGPELSKAQAFYDETPPLGPPLTKADAVLVVRLPGGMAVFIFEYAGQACNDLMIGPAEAPAALRRVLGESI